MLAQSNQNWKAHIVADCPPDEIQNALNQIIIFFEDDRIKLTILPERHNDWGHSPRQYGLENASEEWVVMTGEDNYYAPEFVNSMLQECEDNNFVYCNMVHNWINQDYIPISTQLELGKIDIGCFMCKTEIAKKIKLRNDHPWADWFFVEEYINQYGNSNIKKIDKILYVHN